MKITQIKIVVILLISLCCNLTFAAPDPPQPLDDVPPVGEIPLSTTSDEIIIILLFSALMLGYYNLVIKSRKESNT